MCLSARPAAGLAGALESPTQTAGPAGGLATARPLAPSCLPQGRVGSRPTGGPGESAPPPTAVEGTWTDRRRPCAHPRDGAWGAQTASDLRVIEAISHGDHL